jgi:hypothetical protein
MNPKNKKQVNKHWTKKQNQEAKEPETEVTQSTTVEQASIEVEKTTPREHEKKEDHNEEHFESPEDESIEEHAQVNKSIRSIKSERSESGKHLTNVSVDQSQDRIVIEDEIKSKKEETLNLNINSHRSESQSEVKPQSNNVSRKMSQNDTKSPSRKVTEEKIVSVEEKVITPRKTTNEELTGSDKIIVGLGSDKKSSRKITEEKVEKVETEEKPASRKITEEKLEKVEVEQKSVSRKVTEEKLEKPVSRKVTEEKLEKSVSRKVTEEKLEKPVSRKVTEEKLEKPVSRKVTEEKLETKTLKVEIETSHSTEKIEVVKCDESNNIKIEEIPVVETIKEEVKINLTSEPEKHDHESPKVETQSEVPAQPEIINDPLHEPTEPEKPKEPEVDLIEQEMKKTLLSITALKDEGNRLFKNGEFEKSEEIYKKGVDEVELYILNNKMSYEEFIVNPKYAETFSDINKQRKFLFSNMANALQKQKKYMDVIRIDQFVRNNIKTYL